LAIKLRDASTCSDFISLREMRKASPDSSKTKRLYGYQSSDMILKHDEITFDTVTNYFVNVNLHEMWKIFN